MKDQLIKEFRNRFHKEPDHLFFCPGRVNLIGEHIDYNGGKVMPCAIGLGTYLVVAKNTENVICLVDLDTVMPGYYFSDLGEMIRTMAVSKDVNSIALNDLHIKKDFYDAIVNGYLSIIDYQFSGAERKYVHYSGIMMVYLKALHYLTDYLENDFYYHTEYRGQNLDRAQNQLTLLKKT